MSKCNPNEFFSGLVNLRVRGRTLKVKGGYAWQIFLSDYDNDKKGQLSAESEDVFRSKEEVITDLKIMASELVIDFQKKMYGKASKTYIDLNSGEERKWDRSDEH